MTKPVRSIMTKDVVTIDISRGATEAAHLMTDRHISSVIIVDKEQPVGIRGAAPRIRDARLHRRFRLSAWRPSALFVGRG